MTVSTNASAPNPLLSPLSIFLVAISLSIGWGIRGDFGHESGAWIPGALAAIAVCVLSRREDWWRRFGYSALFGGLGWGFGGSIAYMYTMSFAASGQWQSIWYGYFAVFLVGGLWAGLGGAGTALPLSIERDRLTRLFVPLCFVLAAMYLGEWLENPISRLLATKEAIGQDGTWNRQKDPLYWLDSDWYQATWALAGACVYDLWNRRFGRWLHLIAYGASGALFGFLLQRGLTQAGLASAIARVLVVPQGDLNAVNPDTKLPFDRNDLLTNWPQFFSDFPQHLGWSLGLIAGLIVYFRYFGRWRNDAGLFLWMACGWWLAFLAMPVLGSIPLRNYGGFRLTPPRGDNWAGVLGVFLATCLYARRNGMPAVSYAGAKNFILGGISFPTIHILRALVLIPGHPDLNWATGGTPDAWKHYQSANWHSVLEQSQGFGFGLITALTMASVWKKLKPVSDDPPVRRWTDVVSISFVVFVMTYFNVVKNVEEWTKKGHALVPKLMKAPFFQRIELSATAWFEIAWWTIAIVFIVLLMIHLRRRLAIVPSSWLGRGQLVYFLLLWIMVIADFERSLNGFHEQRLVTEWVIIMNGAIATFLVIALPRPALNTLPVASPDFTLLTRRIWFRGLAAAAVLMSLYAFVNYTVYGKAKIRGPQYRWGEEALWRTKPILKNKPHR